MDDDDGDRHGAFCLAFCLCGMTVLCCSCVALVYLLDMALVDEALPELCITFI